MLGTSAGASPRIILSVVLLPTSIENFSAARAVAVKPPRPLL